MNKEKKKKNAYVYIVISYLGILLIAIAAMRVTVFNDDRIGFFITIFSYLLLISFIRSLERKIGFSSRTRIISRGIFMVLLAISFLLFL
ncbi:hypothetical protein [Virgibacillus necropolis]|uniref:Uncharacterized protein n=1 Tax=Virgibacillus necropolis TaxID=163877 RepID=A0A221MFP1_9BACI|nr:hypothetical protein [Virgibacillus necropolis]ASN06430.1 hypothetical protein CFK40_16095 [Virgibacillus necropolis]